MWVHRSGEFHKERPIVVYEYQKGRDHQKPLDFYRDYKGILVTDGLQQYHLVAKKLPDVTNANCWAHARRDFADAVKAMDKKLHRWSGSPLPIRHCRRSRNSITQTQSSKGSRVKNVFKNGRRRSGRWLRNSLRG